MAANEIKVVQIAKKKTICYQVVLLFCRQGSVDVISFNRKDN